MEKSLDKTKPYFVQHIPAACSGVEQREYNYNDIQEVFKNEIGLFANSPEYVWARGDENLLMISSMRRPEWFVIGRIYNDDISFLPYYREVYCERGEIHIVRDVKEVEVDGYRSPIMGALESVFENIVQESLRKVECHIDKKELKKALNYDRAQYKKGYMKGYEKGYFESKTDLAKQIGETILKKFFPMPKEIIPKFKAFMKVQFGAEVEE